ncbi:MAG: cytochrome c oxidase accessory protein CcoG [Chitinophagales bacterium]|nr:cytochrome c oxidase accessory protein CcoG [Chitinophagales bacterium]
MKESDLVQAKTYRDRVSTVTEKGNRNWVYAQKPEGSFYSIREKLAWLYLAVFFILPFIKVNDMPFFMVNVVEGKFILFSKIFWPQDFFIFAIGMITFIIFIALFTVAYGRLFCGWACPQTIFMEFVFRRIEWLIEGSPTQQKKLNESEWTTEKIIKKVSKHLLFFTFSFLIANTFLSYILGVDRVWAIINEPISQHIGLLLGMLFFTVMFYGVFAFVRDLVCTTICPYGRLQSVMLDKDTMQISYDYQRGEPRGKMTKNQERAFGDCIDCKKCVHVCPTNIDIRNGIQMECVGCTACVDACNNVMQKLNLPPGLIRYASENEIHTGQKTGFNTRTKAYTVLLSLLFLFMLGLLITRKPVDTYIARVKGQLFQETEDNKISNLFEAKIINKTNKDIPVDLKLEGIDGTVRLVGNQHVVLKKEAVNDLTFFVDIPKANVISRSNNIAIGVYKEGEKIQTVKTKFLGPFKN